MTNETQVVSRGGRIRPPKVAVVFRRNHDKYNTGEVAGFPMPYALALMELGIARPNDGDWRGVMLPEEAARSKTLTRAAQRKLLEASGASTEYLIERDQAMTEAEAEEQEARGDAASAGGEPVGDAAIAQVSTDTPEGGDVLARSPAQIKRYLAEPHPRAELEALYERELGGAAPRPAVLASIDAALKEAPVGDNPNAAAPEVEVT